MKQIGKRLFALILSACGLCFDTGCSAESSAAPQVTGSLTVTALDIGKADALLLQTANHTVVLDTGNKGDGKDIEKILEKSNVSKIDALIVSHFDKDHVGGAARLLNRMDVEKVYLPDYAGTVEEYVEFQEKLENSNAETRVMQAGTSQSWTLDDVSFSLYAAQKNDYGKKEENDFSLCLYLRHGENTFLFAGDAEETRQQEILDLKLGSVNYLKYPYHGNYLASTENFLDGLKPQYAVICCSEKEFAQDETVETLQKRGIQAYYTANGKITAVSDGKNIKITQ